MDLLILDFGLVHVSVHQFSAHNTDNAISPPNQFIVPVFESVFVFEGELNQRESRRTTKQTHEIGKSNF